MDRTGAKPPKENPAIAVIKGSGIFGIKAYRWKKIRVCDKITECW